MSASRHVTRAVSAVLDLAPRRGEVSLTRLVDAVSKDRERPIELKMADLPPGVCGQWRQYADRDVFLIQKGLPAWDRTLAHELGHLVLGSNEHSESGLMRAVWTAAEVARNRPADWVFSSGHRAVLLNAWLNAGGKPAS